VLSLPPLCLHSKDNFSDRDNTDRDCRCNLSTKHLKNDKVLTGSPAFSHLHAIPISTVAPKQPSFSYSERIEQVETVGRWWWGKNLDWTENRLLSGIINPLYPGGHATRSSCTPSRISAIWPLEVGVAIFCFLANYSYLIDKQVLNSNTYSGEICLANRKNP
jgi:hypothetical protein